MKNNCPNCGADSWIGHLDTDRIKEGEAKCCNCNTLFREKEVWSNNKSKSKERIVFEIMHLYTDIKDIQFHHKHFNPLESTLVLLHDDTIGCANLRNGDAYTIEKGILYAYIDAKRYQVKKLNKKLRIANENKS